MQHGKMEKEIIGEDNVPHSCGKDEVVKVECLTETQSSINAITQ